MMKRAHSPFSFDVDLLQQPLSSLSSITCISTRLPSSNFQLYRFVIRDGDGRPIIAEASNAGKITVPVAEATALRIGLVAAKQKGLRRLEAEGDSKLVIDAVNGVSAPPWRLKKIIEDIRMLAQDLEAIHFKHILREANFVADAIADLGHNCNAVTWHDGVPKEASRALLFDIVNTECPRGFSL